MKYNPGFTPQRREGRREEMAILCKNVLCAHPASAVQIQRRQLLYRLGAWVAYGIGSVNQDLLDCSEFDGKFIKELIA